MKLFEGISPEAVAGFEAYLAENHPGATPQEAACVLTRRMIAEEVKEYTRKAFPDIDGVASEMVEAISGETIEELLEAMVEGDVIIDDDEVHAFHRRKLDELRASLARVEAKDLTSLSYEAIQSDFVTASTMMQMGVLDAKTMARVALVRVWGTLIREENAEGREVTQEDAERLFQVASLGVIAHAHDVEGMSIEDISDAIGSPVDVVKEALALLAREGHRKAG